MSRTAPSTQRIQALDGLRGIAVLAVILFHHALFGAGWVGVQLFFVLSGYLITSNLLRDKELPAAAFFGSFYRRRSLRIFPVYFAYLAVLACLAAVSSKAREFHDDWPYLVSYTYNLTHLSAEWKLSWWYSHFWSLCIEEQYYLVWPLVVYTVTRGRLKGVLIGMIALAPVVRWAAARVLASRLSPENLGEAVYWFTPAQMDGFAVGSVIAVFPWRERPHESTRGARLLAALAIVAGLGNLLLFLHEGRLPERQDWTCLGYPLASTEHAQHVWSYTLLDAACGLLVVGSVRGERWTRFFQHPWLTFVGRVSYCAYVVHPGVIIVVRKALTPYGWSDDTVAGRLLLLAVSLPLILAVSAASYRWFEGRLLALRSSAPATRSASV
ncbi:MAG TPA: acyltransferase [Polyangiaceae bacterium]|nr:acyltransferase [Polyangiaceae bacterium]